MLDLRSLSSVTDFFVICTAGSARQIDAIKDSIEGVLARQGYTVFHIEGSSVPGKSTSPSRAEPCWVLMDCGDVVAHILDQQARGFYRLEDLWADAPRVAIELTASARDPSKSTGSSTALNPDPSSTQPVKKRRRSA